MSGIEEIDQAVQNLGPGELSRFRDWFQEFDALAWDERFERDVVAGKLDGLADTALAAHRRGDTRPL